MPWNEWITLITNPSLDSRDIEQINALPCQLSFLRVELPESERGELARGAFNVGISTDDLRTILTILLRNELLRLLEEDSPSIE